MDGRKDGKSRRPLSVLWATANGAVHQRNYPYPSAERMIMVKFGDLSQSEKQAFEDFIKKNAEKPEKEPPTQIWPDDDEEFTESYFVSHKQK